MSVQPEEVEIVKRIFKEFSFGISINKILAGLNIDKIPTKMKYRGGWNQWRHYDPISFRMSVAVYYGFCDRNGVSWR